jgi:hypothetical protein
LNAKNVLLISGITLPLNAREITLGISERNIENQFTVNNILFILKCYIYIGADVRVKSHTYTEVFNTSNYIKIEKKSSFYISPKKK